MLLNRPKENFIYFHQLDVDGTSAAIWIPTYPLTMDITNRATYGTNQPLGSPNQIYSWSGSGPRSATLPFNLNRDMMQIINGGNMYADNELGRMLREQDADAVEVLIRYWETIALPSYQAAKKMINPPLVTIKIANQLTITGVATGGMQIRMSGGWRNGKQLDATLSATISEIDPIDATTAARVGQYRGINATLAGRMGL